MLVSRILRHKSVAITERVYVHVHGRQLVAAADKLERVLGRLQVAGARAKVARKPAT